MMTGTWDLTDLLTLQIRSGLKQTVLIDHLRSRLLYLDVRWLLIIVVAFA
jgi:hypothetical protein